MKLGMITSLENFTNPVRQGWDYLEATVQNFFVPNEGDEVFDGLLAEVRNQGIEIPAACSFIPKTIPVVGPERDLEGAIQWGETVFRRAEKAGTRIIVFGSGGARRRPDGVSVAEGRLQFAEVLQRLAPLAHNHGVTLVIEPLNFNECNLINTLAEGAELVNTCSHPAIQLLADFYHMAMVDEPASEIVRFGSMIKHTHTAEKEGRSAPGVHGQDFTPYLKALREIGYEGMLSVECKWTDMTREAPVSLRTLHEQLAS